MHAIATMICLFSLASLNASCHSGQQSVPANGTTGKNQPTEGGRTELVHSEADAKARFIEEARRRFGSTLSVSSARFNGEAWIVNAYVEAEPGYRYGSVSGEVRLSGEVKFGPMKRGRS
jgi:hypothetical protein